jgi:hypothetical protein
MTTPVDVIEILWETYADNYDDRLAILGRISLFERHIATMRV